MDLAHLRHTLQPLIIGLGGKGTHNELPRICAEVGLPVPPDDGTKAEKMKSCFEAASDEDLPDIARRFLAFHSPPARVRNELQDLLWEDRTIAHVTKRVRREVALAIEGIELYRDAGRFDELLDGLWILDDGDLLGAFFSSGRSLREQIERHIHRNPGDWSVEELFDYLGVFEASDQRFLYFLEGLASADVRPDEAAQRELVARVNPVLAEAGIELRETDVQEGYPVFTAVVIHIAAKGRPKNLIFASPVKPDLRFTDAVNNDIEIVTNADKVLVYDRPITIEGIRWRDLREWWGETQGICDQAEAKKTLYHRLLSSLPDNSPPQRFLFESYFRTFGRAIPGLPALLPEVWLHWDPKTVRERGRQALLTFRMDFLMLMPRGVRVVIEVDGVHHYASNGRADPSVYAQTAAGDRDLKLAGYQVFRFGAHELGEEDAVMRLRAFFDALFLRYGVSIL